MNMEDKLTLKEYMLKEIEIIQDIIKRMARMYRELYNWVISNRLKTDEHLFDMNAYRFKDKVQSKFRIMFSITLGWFYGSIAVLIAIYSIALLLLQKGGN